MVALVITMAVVLLLLVAVGIAAAWYCRPPAGADRIAAARGEALLAEARIDQLTRHSMQQMRDVVRDQQRGRRCGEVIEGDIVE